MNSADADLDDDAPIVVLDRDEDLAVLPASAEMVLDAAAQTYLASQGLTDPETWSAFRLGQVDPPALERLGLADRKLARGVGINLPTCDPRDPGNVIGVVRLTPAQNKHGFLSAPAGLGGPVGLGIQPRIVLADSPFLAMRLHQAGVRGVALVEDPAVLPPLAAWFAGREVLVAGYRQDGIAAMRDALLGAGIATESVLVKAILARSGARALGLLGIDPAAVAPPEVAVPLTPLLLTELHAYACGRMSAGVASSALRTLEAEHADLVCSYRVGFLPADYQEALSRPAKRALRGVRLAQTLILPATDEQGVIVDLLIVHARESGRSHDGCFPEPRGLLGGHVVGSSDHLIVTDTFRWLARLVRQGYRNVLLLRGPADAATNARRIATAGVRSVIVRSRRDGDAIAAALAGAGIHVVVESGPITGDDWVTAATAPPTASDATPMPPQTAGVEPAPVATPASEPPMEPMPIVAPDISAPVQTMAPAEQTALVDDPIGMAVRLVDFDRERNLAHFEVGPLRYAIEVAEHELPTRQVVARRGQACHQDRINLDLPVQRRRFAASAARRLTVDHQRIEAHLADAWRQLREREGRIDGPPAVTVDGEERVAAEALLRDPGLLPRLGRDLEAMGWVGESSARSILYLTAVSRLLPDPLWSVYRATAGAAPWKSLGIIAALTPPEDCVVFHRLTESVLRRTDQRALRHRLLLVDRAETLRPEGAVALRCLREWGGIGWQQVAQAEGAGGAGILGEARGPVAVLAAAAGELDLRCRDCFLSVTVDESPEQTARTLADQRRQHGRGGLAALEAQAIIRRHHALQRLLRPAPVVIPFSDRIAFPMTSVRHRDEQAAFLRLIAASAILHQFQRTRDTDGAVLAVEADFEHALAAAGHLLGLSGDGLSLQGRHLVQRLFAAGWTSFVLSDLGGLVPDWTAYTYRATAEELVQMGYCSATGGGQGRVRRYALEARGGGVAGIRLLPVGSGLDTPATLRPCDASGGASQGATPVAAVG